MTNINCEHCVTGGLDLDSKDIPGWCWHPKIKEGKLPSAALSQNVGVPPKIPVPGNLLCGDTDGSCDGIPK